MPRLKLPPPAKRRELMEAAASRAVKNHTGRYGLIKIGYAMALRHVHKIRNVEARQRWRRSFARADLHRLELEAHRKEIAELRDKLAKASGPQS